MTCNPRDLMLQLTDLQAQLKNLRDFNCREQFDTEEDIKQCLVGRAQAMGRVKGGIQATMNQMRICGEVNSLLSGIWDVGATQDVGQVAAQHFGQFLIGEWEFFGETVDITLILDNGQANHQFLDQTNYNPLTKGIRTAFFFPPGITEDDLIFTGTVDDSTSPPTATGTLLGVMAGSIAPGGSWSAVKR